MGKAYQVQLSGANKLIYDIEDGKVAIQFEVNTPATTYEKGQVVTLLNTGKVEIKAAANFPFGYVKVQNNVDDLPGAPQYRTVTVIPFAQDAVYGYAKGGTLAIGALVNADGQHTGDEGYMDYITAASGTYATGIVVEGGTVGTSIVVLLFNQPVLIP